MVAKTIDTLVEDILSLFQKPHEASSEAVEALGQAIANTVAARLSAPPRAPTLRLSALGKQCERQLWYDINTPEMGEELPPEAKIKFLFGDILEHLLLFLAKEAGHKVEGEQDELSVHGVVGHRDAIIDGRTVDCKSASTFSFKKFASNGLIGEDPFGYIGQLGSYFTAGLDDPRVTDKENASFLVIDKTLGNICLDTYKFEPTTKEWVDGKREMVAKNLPPKRAYSDEAEGKSGNRKLGVGCSYCSYKQLCWPGLRTFIYSYGPTYLTWVEREPKVPEATFDE